ncbi:MAG: ankyrin repeat domain-containing protein [Rhodobacteraceae bacterium]|nr:ankyrin repeat domain-containing protein [Paracoccaceae bacterium]
MWKSVSLSLVMCVIGAGVASAEQCDFLAPDYFSRPEAIKDSSFCLLRGYTFDIRDTDTLDTPLHLAVRNSDDPSLFGQLEILIPEAQRQKLISQPNKDDFNPFHLSVTLGRPPAITVRLSNWGDVVNSKSSAESKYLVWSLGKTALHLAVAPEIGREPSIEMVMTLLAVGANPTLEDVEGNRPYFYAQKAPNALEMALLLDDEAWRAKIADKFDPQELLAEAKNTTLTGDSCSDFLSPNFFQTTDALAIWNCVISWANSQSEPEALWSMRTQNGDNALHIALKAGVEREKLNALLAAADETGALETALSSEDRNGRSPIQIAAEQSTDPLIIVALERWGADVDRIANVRDNGFLETKTGTTAMHLAAKREDSEMFITALLAVGANPHIYDNNSKENPLDKLVGLAPLDYLSRSQSLNAMALIAPKFNYCEVVSESKEAVAALVGLGAGATGTAVAATTGLGMTAVTHSSGAVILTGSSGYIAGTLGTVGSGALAFLTAPATLTAAAVSVVAFGGSVYYCHSAD